MEFIIMILCIVGFFAVDKIDQILTIQAKAREKERMSKAYSQKRGVNG